MEKEARERTAVRAVLFAAGAAVIAVGVVTGKVRRLEKKAVDLCLACMGI